MLYFVYTVKKHHSIEAVQREGDRSQAVNLALLSCSYSEAQATCVVYIQFILMLTDINAVLLPQ